MNFTTGSADLKSMKRANYLVMRVLTLNITAVKYCALASFQNISIVGGSENANKELLRGKCPWKMLEKSRECSIISVPGAHCASSCR